MSFNEIYFSRTKTRNSPRAESASNMLIFAPKPTTKCKKETT